MSYKTYTTEALVCGSYNHNTADKQYLLFTRESGMLLASARSAREERSKQRYALQDFSHVRVSLVKGKNGWRVGSAEALGNPFLEADTRTKRTLIHFVFLQLRRYVHGEVSSSRIFNDSYEVLKDRDTFLPHYQQVEQLFLVRLLTELGYISPAHTWKGLIEAPSVGEALAEYTEAMKDSLRNAIEQGEEVSHL